MNKFTIVSIIAMAVLVVVLSFPRASNEHQITPASLESSFALADAASSTRLQVVGIVDAADSAVISAKTNGVLAQLSVLEGAVVTPGAVVAVQSTPVADAQVAYQAAQGELTTAEQQAAVDVRQYSAEKAAVVARSAETIALIQTEAVASQLRAEAAAMRTATEAGVTTMLDTLAFVHENPSLFADSERAQFRAIVSDLYGSLPNHFSPTVRYAADRDGADVMVDLEALRAVATAELSVIDVETLSVVVMGQLQALLQLYTSGEGDVLDRDEVSQSDGLYTSYFTNRNQITSALTQLESAAQRLQQRVDDLAETAENTNHRSLVSNIDEVIATRQHTFSEQIAAAATRVTAAASAVAAAERSLGVVTAPFAGMVSTVYVEVGEYVTAGQPLFALKGTGSRELEVSVPTEFASALQVGDAFYIDQTRAGVVDRVQVAETGHSVTVFISLLDTDIPVGTSMNGELVLRAFSDAVTVPREYVFFGVARPFVRSNAGVSYEVDIVADGGKTLTVKFITDVPAFTELVANHGITF